jgi:hypothetical protein
MSDTNFGEWDGNDRRMAPGMPGNGGGGGGGVSIIDLLRYLEARQDQKFAQYTADLRQHTVEEMGRYDAILTKLDDNDKSAEVRHAGVVTQIAALGLKADAVESAFVLDDRGRPDYSGHRTDHQVRKSWGDWWRTTRSRTGTQVVVAICTIFAIYLLIKALPMLAPAAAQAVMSGM